MAVGKHWTDLMPRLYISENWSLIAMDFPGYTYVSQRTIIGRQGFNTEGK